MRRYVQNLTKIQKGVGLVAKVGMDTILKKIDKAINDLEKAKMALEVLYAEQQDKEYEIKHSKKYIVCNQKGEVALTGNQYQVFGFLNISEAKLKELVESGDEYNGFTVDEE